MMNEDERNAFAERLVKLNTIYNESLRLRLVRSKKEFAAMVGINFTTMSAAMNGSEKYLSEKLIIRAEDALASKKGERELEELAEAAFKLKENAVDEPKEADTAENGIGSEDLRAIVHEIMEAFNKERESHERIVMAMLETLKK